MTFISTRNGSQAPRTFTDVLLSGLAPDGGLFVPDIWPSLSDEERANLRGQPYARVAAAVLAPFAVDAVAQPTLERMAHATYGRFRHPATAPLVQLADDLWLLELFHGPTFAFKDYALQMLGALFDHVLATQGERITVIGATSGDTGSAAIEACRDREAVDIFILYPHGRVSEVQRRQMTTVASSNVHTLAIDGTFDDCQDIVKALFANADAVARLRLAAVNSINWVRIAAQAAYYASSSLALGGQPVSYAVPTGNFGNVFAAEVARRMGFPIRRLVVGTNRNDILHRFFQTGVMARDEVHPTLSPSMDIQISSNFERLLFELVGRDGAETAAKLATFRQSGRFDVSQEMLAAARHRFASVRIDDGATLAEIARTHGETGLVIDPHTAVGVAAARHARAEGIVQPEDGPIVALACAHPAKFPDAVAKAIGKAPKTPEPLAAMLEAPERSTRLPNDTWRVLDYIQTQARAAAASAEGGWTKGIKSAP